MWKEWTKKIKTFAEDITSPDYDDDAREAGREKDEDEAEEEAHAAYNRSARHTQAAASGQWDQQRSHGGGAPPLLETPARRLERSYDEPTVDRRAGGPPSALHTAAGPDSMAYSSEEHDRGTSSTYRDPEEDEAEAVHPAPPASSASLLPVSSAPRRGPPQARTTPRPLPHQEQQPLAPTQSVGKTASSSPSLSTSPAVRPAATPTDVATAVVNDDRAGLPSPSAPVNEAVATAASHSNDTTSRTDKPAAATGKGSELQQHQLEEQQQRIAKLEAERAQMLDDIRSYQDEVRVAHERTVAYYEAQQSTLLQESKNAAALAAAQSQEQLDSLNVALRTAAAELERGDAERTELLRHVAQLEKENEKLRNSLTDAQAKNESVVGSTDASSSPHTDADWAALEAECAKLRSSVAQLEQLKEAAAAASTASTQSAETQRHEAEAAFAAQLGALQAELTSCRLRAEETETELIAARKLCDTREQELAKEKERRCSATSAAAAAAASEAASLSSDAANIEEVKELRQQLQSAEAARRGLEGQLQEAQAELMAAFAAPKQPQRRDEEERAEELSALMDELQVAQQRTAELEQNLASAHQQNERLTSQLAEEQAKGSAAQASSDATSRASVDEIAALTHKLQTSVSQCTALQAEAAKHKPVVDQLTQCLKAEAAKNEKERAQMEEEHAEAEAALEDELEAYRAEVAKERKLHEEQLQRLKAELQQVQRRLAVAEGEGASSGSAREAAEARARTAEQQCKALEDEVASLQQQLRSCKADIAQQQREMKELADKAAGSGAAMSVATLTSMKRELEEKLQTLEITVEQVRRMTVDTLVRLGVDVPHATQQQQQQQRKHHDVAKSESGAQSSEHTGNSNSDEDEADDSADERGSQQQQQLPLLQLLSLLTTECVQQHGIVLRAERVQQEWEQTYEQARQVNDSLNQQVADAWATIGKLREDLSVKDATARQMQSRVGSGDARLVEVQEELARVSSELQQLREERDGWETRLQYAEAGAEGQEQTLATLQEELQSAHALLLAKEEEVQSSQQSLENLQMVLDRFQDTKRQEVASLTLEAHMEADAVKEELAEARRVLEQHDQAKAAVREAYESQLASKDAEVTTLHRKLAEVRKVLERTTSRHMDGTETSVDKRVVSQLLAKYIHAFIGQRKEAEDMLKVLSGLLDWDEATQEMAGLLPGPNNPHPPGSGPDGQRGGGGGGRTGLFSWRRRKDASATTTAAPRAGEGTAGASKSGLASMWVDFLLKESEKAASGSGGSTAAAAAATPALEASAASSTGAPATPHAGEKGPAQ